MHTPHIFNHPDMVRASDPNRGYGKSWEGAGRELGADEAQVLLGGVSDRSLCQGRALPRREAERR
eukprot:731774-Hanusia_phi.AAC.1